MSPLEWVIRPDRVSHQGVAASGGRRRRRRHCQFGEVRTCLSFELVAIRARIEPRRLKSWFQINDMLRMN